MRQSKKPKDRGSRQSRKPKGRESKLNKKPKDREKKLNIRNWNLINTGTAKTLEKLIPLVKYSMEPNSMKI